MAHFVGQISNKLSLTNTMLAFFKILLPKLFTNTWDDIILLHQMAICCLMCQNSMKPFFLKVATNPNHSFSIRNDESPFFFNTWHYHPEVELVWVRASSGTRIIGDSAERFEAGDMVLLGANLPHMWRNDTQYFEGLPDLKARSTVVHFRADFWGTAFLELPEMKGVAELLKRAERGLHLDAATAEKVQDCLSALSQEEKPGFERLTGLLKILNIMALSKNLRPISAAIFSKNLYVENDAERINKIYTYIVQHFQKNIKLEEVAAIANISPHSFCRYFKHKTHKTYSQFLTDIRIGQACKMLIENQKSISEICYECGFNNLSNFNRHFKKMKNLTPTEYAKQFY